MSRNLKERVLHEELMRVMPVAYSDSVEVSDWVSPEGGLLCTIRQRHRKGPMKKRGAGWGYFETEELYV